MNLNLEEYIALVGLWCIVTAVYLRFGGWAALLTLGVALLIVGLLVARDRQFKRMMKAKDAKLR